MNRATRRRREQSVIRTWRSKPIRRIIHDCHSDETFTSMERVKVTPALRELAALIVETGAETPPNLFVHYTSRCDRCAECQPECVDADWFTRNPVETT